MCDEWRGYFLKMRIGVIMYQTSTSKGQELVAQRMVSYFRRSGHDAYLITSVYHDGKEVVSEDSIADKEYVLIEDHELNIPIIRVGSFTSRWPPRRILFKDSIHTLERIVNEFDLTVLITHSTLWNGPEEVAKFVEWRRNIKTLGGYQDPLIFCHMSHFHEPSAGGYSIIERSFRIAWNQLSLKTILRVADLILVVTPFERENKVKLGASGKKCILFPGGVDDYTFLTFAASRPKELIQQFGISSDARIVSYIGTIEERKNPKAILDVAEHLTSRKDIHFVIAGRGDGEYAAAMKERATHLPNVTALGELSEKEKVQLIETSYLNILLSRMEALGLTQLEFMFQGVPVITSGIGGQSWIVENDKDGIQVDGPDDVDGAVNAVVELVNDSRKWSRLSIHAKEKAAEFTLTRLIHNLEGALTNEIERETGISALPAEVRSTLPEPEIVVQTWSHGTRRLITTNKRLFIQRGRLSRSIIEIPYTSIKSIEYIRRYDWRTLLSGAGLSLLMFIHHYISPILSRTFTSKFVSLITLLVPNIRPNLPQILADIWTLPVTVTFIIFLFRARKGYALHGPTRKPIYLPPSFGEAVDRVRSIQQGKDRFPKRDKTLQAI
jgi:glycosyltransferase involved in cell wall biosynthesis